MAHTTNLEELPVDQKEVIYLDHQVTAIVDDTADSKDQSEENISIPEEYTACGIGWFKPKWLQVFASKKAFVIVYSMAGLTQFILSSYFVGILSTLEKNFKMSSQMAGIISGSWDFGALFTNVSITYIAAKGHRTRWVAWGMFITGLTCYLRILPYLVYGPGEDIKMYTVEYASKFNVTEAKNANITIGNSTSGIQLLRTDENCGDAETGDLVSIYIMLISHIILGMGTSVYWTCGAAYLDDNARKNIVPVLLAFVQAIRMFGPTIGFLLSSYVLEIYVDPSLTPTITNDDPRWIGAWWLGWYPIGAACIVSAGCLALFPRILPRAALRKKYMPTKNEPRSMSDFKRSLKRITSNKIIVFNSFSSVCFVMGVMAYWNFMPKYMETQFRVSASKSNFLTGTVGILSNALGIVVSGVVISKLRPSPRFLAGWNVFVELLDVVGHASFSLLSCKDQKIHGHFNDNKSWNLTMSCNTNYTCGTDIQYSPVCDISNELMYYSPCHAGCTYTSFINGTKMYGNCSCVPDYGSVTEGQCPTDCSLNLLIFTLIMGTLSFTSATGRSGNTLIQFRSVSEEDKSLSIGITEALLSLLAFSPSPIVYGMIVDWTCLVWGDNCGKRGNCWLYNGVMLRYVFNLTASSFLLMGTILDLFVWYYVKDLKIYDEDFEKGDGEELNEIRRKEKMENNNTAQNSDQQVPLIIYKPPD